MQGTKRYCKHCGANGVPKGRRYHPECKPGQRVVTQDCIDCGKRRKVWLARPRLRCRTCDLNRRGGPLNNRWRGGVTPVNRAARNTREYRAWRSAVFTRDGFVCVWCGQRGGQLHADHIKPFSTHPELRLSVANGRTLCVACHMKTDSFLGKARRLNFHHTVSRRQTRWDW